MPVRIGLCGIEEPESGKRLFQCPEIIENNRLVIQVIGISIFHDNS